MRIWHSTLGTIIRTIIIGTIIRTKITIRTITMRTIASIRTTTLFKTNAILRT
jgi:hypothetical protein